MGCVSRPVPFAVVTADAEGGDSDPFARSSFLIVIYGHFESEIICQLGRGFSVHRGIIGDGDGSSGRLRGQISIDGIDCRIDDPILSFRLSFKDLPLAIYQQSDAYRPAVYHFDPIDPESSLLCKVIRQNHRREYTSCIFRHRRAFRHDRIDRFFPRDIYPI